MIKNELFHNLGTEKPPTVELFTTITRVDVGRLEMQPVGLEEAVEHGESSVSQKAKRRLK